MNEFTIKSVFAGVCTVFGYFFGAWDVGLQVLIAFIVLDYLTGVTAAIINKTLSSQIGFRGLFKKIGILIMVTMGVMIDRLTGAEGIVRTAVIYFYIANEGISILENWGKAGLPLPKKLLDVLEQIKAKSEEDIEHEL